MDQVLFKTIEGRTDELLSFIQRNRTIIEDHPFAYCTVPHTITFKEDMEWEPIYSKHEIKAGDTYFWAIAYHETASWIPQFFKDVQFPIQTFYYEDVPDYWLAGYEGTQNGSSIEFENEFVIIKPIAYECQIN